MGTVPAISSACDACAKRLDWPGWIKTHLGRAPARRRRRKPAGACAAERRSNVEPGQVASIAGAGDSPHCPLRPPDQAATAPAVSRSRPKPVRPA